MKLYQSVLFPILLFLSACSCQIPEAPADESLTIMTWNVQNLFDDISSGREYPEFDPEKSDWGEDLLRMRLENIKEVIFSVQKDGPDIIMLQEVENRSVLERLNRDYLNEAYPYLDAWEYDDSAIRCGYLSRLAPENVHLHFPGNYGSYPLRAVAEIHFRVGGEELVIMNNHWKSRSGGFMATESGRIKSAAVVSYRLKQLQEEGDPAVIVVGDLNGSSSDYRSGGSQTAQIPIEYVLDTSWQDSLYIAENPGDMSTVSDRTVLFSPWKDMAESSGAGSYFYQNRWMRLDHLHLSSTLLDGSGWEYESARCLCDSWLCDPEGHPSRWESWNGSGYSDHFPLILTLQKVE
ncbi:MAG: hypothetical protein B6241_12095 [Spirochaetaceae bacterium 4572_59]|nr:MAG: hypothetical protein B6241_12095 [Spirochaetaceae bacterium 4572_59]